MARQILTFLISFLSFILFFYLLIALWWIILPLLLVGILLSVIRIYQFRRKFKIFQDELYRSAQHQKDEDVIDVDFKEIKE